MTGRDASALQCQLDAMRLARAEDAKTCARLTARVKELEAEVARWRANNRADVAIALAEGTRDEKAARCAGCLVPVEGGVIVCAACRRGEVP
jgi:hypothetical protein